VALKIFTALKSLITAISVGLLSSERDMFHA